MTAPAETPTTAPDPRLPATTPDARPLVLHVIHHLKMGGMENGLVNLVNRLPAARWRHAIACVEDHSDFRDRIVRPDVEVIALHRSRIGTWGLRRALWRLVRQRRPAIVHTRNLSGLDALAPAWLAGGCRRVHGEHGWDVSNLDGFNRKQAWLRRLHAPLVERYVTVSKDLERFLTGTIGIDAGRIAQIYNGVDTARFAPGAARLADGDLPEAMRGDGLVTIGTVGRLQAVKDQATLLRAAAALARSQPALGERLRVVVAGGGPLEADLRALADSLGLTPRTWFAGARDDVPALLGTFDVFVLPSLKEGISNTLLEAMASGLPVAATASGGNVELVEDGRWGRLFAPGDVAALEAILAGYAADAALRARHGAEARRAAVERFSLDAMVARYDALYDAMLAGRGRR